MYMTRSSIGLGIMAMTIFGWSAYPAKAQTVQEYGTENLLGTGTYSSDPKAGATLYGLSAGTITEANLYFAHGYPFAPSPGDYAGTDQIYVGSTQTANHDGYSNYSGRVQGPQVISMDYSSLLPAGQQVQTLTVGIGTDDFQNSVFGDPFSATLNGVAVPGLTAELNSLNETGPLTHFFTFGVNPSLLTSSNNLVLSISEGGDGGDGWAIDFLTLGVTTTPAAVPEASTTVSLGLMLALGLGGMARARRRKARSV